MNILKKLYPYTIVIAFIFYVIIIEELKVITSSAEADVNPFLFFNLIILLVGVGLGIVLDLSSRNVALRK